MISIEGLHKADVLAALYNRSRPLGMGFLQYDPAPMGREEAEEILKITQKFDYLRGRVMKLSLKEDSFDSVSYDRDNGLGAAQGAIDALRTSGNLNPASSSLQHIASTQESAEEVKKRLDEETTVSDDGIVYQVSLGLKGAAKHLGPVVEKVLHPKLEENKG